MPLLKKKIVSPGVYRTTDLATGKVREETVTPDRIQHWASEGTRYLTAGNQLPAPWSHVDPNTGLPVMVSANGILPRSDINGGFWKFLTTEFDPEEGLTLVGYVDVDGDENDPNTPAGKVGKTVRETSIFALPQWADGKGNSFVDVPMHVAMITHAIQPNQKNFEKVPDGALAIAMSHRVHSFKPTAMASPPSSIQGSTDPSSGGQSGGQAGNKPGGQSYGGGNGQSSPTATAASADITQVIAALRQCGIDLPDDTSPMNFFERLLVACRQKSVSEGNQGGDLYSPPEGAATQQPAPVAMSQNPPATTAPGTFDFSKVPLDVFMSHPAAKQLVDANNQLQSIVLEQAKTGLQLRIKKLIEGGTITQKYADEMLKPLLDGFAMSHIGKPNAVEATLTAIEATAVARQPQGDSVAQQALLMNLPMSAAYDPLAMSAAPPRQTIDNPFIQANGQGNAAGITPQGTPAGATDIIKDFFDATGGIAVSYGG
jgi:hypothetical protein